MRIIAESLVFNWDEGNIRKNLEKHTVTMQESEEIFGNEPQIVAHNVAHSKISEDRYYLLGQTKAGRKLFAAFTIRAGAIRIISIRDMSKPERMHYEKF